MASVGGILRSQLTTVYYSSKKIYYGANRASVEWSIKSANELAHSSLVCVSVQGAMLFYATNTTIVSLVWFLLEVTHAANLLPFTAVVKKITTRQMGLLLNKAQNTVASIPCVSVEYTEVLFQSLKLAAMLVRNTAQGIPFYTPLGTLRCAINNTKHTLCNDYFIQRMLKSHWTNIFFSR